MKSNTFAKIFLGLFLFTFSSFVVAGYAAQRAHIANPNLVDDMAKRFNVQITSSNTGFFITSAEDEADFEKVDKTWDFDGHQATLDIDVRTANVIFTKSTDGKIHIIAEGLFNKHKSRDIFEVEADSKKISISDDHTSTKDAKLTIQLPAPLTELKVKTISGDVIMTDTPADEADVKTVSGSVQLRGTHIKNLNLFSTSGDIQVTNNIPADISAQSVSGDVSIKSAGLDQSAIKITSVSGDITNPFKEPAKTKHTTKITTVSGDVELEKVSGVKN